MTNDTLAKQVSLAAGRVAALRRQAQQAGGAKAVAILAEALEELGTAYEELNVAQEELRTQNEALAAAEAVAAAEVDRYRDLFEFAPVGYLVTDAEGTVVTSNRAARELLGFAGPRYLAGKPLAVFVAAEDRKAFLAQLSSLQAGDPVWGQTLRLQPRPEGSEPRVADLLVVPFRDPGTRKPMFRWQLRDVTEAWRSAEELRRVNADLEARVQARTAELERAAARLREADRRKDEFLATLAHELRDPLTPIRTAVRILHRGEPDGPDARQALDVIDRQAVRLSRLADELLDVSRLARGQLRLFAERVDLGEAVARVAEAVAARAEERGVRLAVEPPADPVRVVADPSRLDQILFHLIDNGVKFTAAGGAVGVAVGVKAGRAYVQVKDTGVGIAADALPRVFDLFAPADRAADGPQFGLGVGLALVKRLVELHGGSVKARSGGIARGSEFVVYLPTADSAGAEVSVPAAGGDGEGPHEVTEGQPADLPREVAVLAHETRNALQRAHACLRMLRQDVADRPAAVELADRAGRALVGLDRLFEDVRAGSGKPALRPEPCDLAAVWREAWQQVLPPGRAAALNERADGADLAVVGDRFRLGQVFTNLFDNALAAGATAVRVAVADAVVGGRPGVRVAVRDDGGMPPEARDRLFEPYFTTKPNGTGLGLVVVRDVVEAHGGTAAVTDHGPGGTEIVFTLTRDGP